MVVTRINKGACPFDVTCSRQELKWSQGKLRKIFTCFLCVLMMWSDVWGWSLGKGANFYFNWGTKKLALSGRESSLVQTFCESCVHLDMTHPSVHMTQRFVIQGCPTLMDLYPFHLIPFWNGRHPLTSLHMQWYRQCIVEHFKPHNALYCKEMHTGDLAD